MLNATFRRFYLMPHLWPAGGLIWCEDRNELSAFWGMRHCVCMFTHIPIKGLIYVHESSCHQWIQKNQLPNLV